MDIKIKCHNDICHNVLLMQMVRNTVFTIMIQLFFYCFSITPLISCILQIVLMCALFIAAVVFIYLYLKERLKRMELESAASTTAQNIY